MEESKLNKILDGLRYDLDFLLKNYFCLDEGSFNDVKNKTEKAIVNIDNIKQNLSLFFSSMVDRQYLQSLDEQAHGSTAVMVNIKELYYEIRNGKYALSEELFNQVSIITGWIEELNLEVDNLAVSVNQNSTDIESLKQSVLTNSDNIENLDNRVTTLEQTGGSGGSAEGGGDCSCDLSGVENDIHNLQNDVFSLQNQINGLKAEQDDNYIGKSFSDYPAGTIIQSYDFVEYDNLTITSTGTASLPPVCFCAEVGSAGKFKIHTEFNVKLIATNVVVKCTFNDTVIDEQIFEVTQTDFNYIYDKWFTDILYNAEEKGNKIEIIVALSGTASSTRSVEVTNMKVEVFAPNADIINKQCPVDICEYENNYVISDCRSGEAKVCKVNTNEIINVKSLTFESLNMPALRCQLRPVYKLYDTNYVYDYDGMLVKGTDNKYYTYSNNVLLETDATSIWKECFKQHHTLFGLVKLSNEIRVYINRINTSISAAAGKYNDNAVACFGFNSHINQKYQTSFNLTISVNKNGILQFMPTYNKDIVDICYGHNPTIYLNYYYSSTDFKFDLYYKYYDKIICKKMKFYATTLTCLETIEVGTYDYYYKNIDGSYFALKDNVLTYHGAPYEPTEEQTE